MWMACCFSRIITHTSFTNSSLYMHHPSPKMDWKGWRATIFIFLTVYAVLPSNFVLLARCWGQKLEPGTLLVTGTGFSSPTDARQLQPTIIEDLNGTFYSAVVSTGSRKNLGPWAMKVKPENCYESFDVLPHHDLIVDLSCTRPFRTAFYHRMVECFVPSFCALTMATGYSSALYVVPAYLHEVYTYFLSDIHGYTMVSYHTEKPKFCLNIPNSRNLTMFYPNWGLSAKQQTTCLERMSRILKLRDGHEDRHGKTHIVLIHRNCTRPRCFKDPGRILKSYTSQIGLPGVIYFGNESFEDTVRLFHNAKVVVGYHGAGFANTIFCRAGTVILEYTTFHDMDATQMWRSNEEIAKVHVGLIWLKHTLDVDHLVDLDKLTNATDKDHYIKGRRYVQITGSDLYNSVERVKREIE